ncbi:MAG: protein kinase domain-containing protein [Planctomycetota bacterium]|jgi:Tol biopolymer transport system component
MKQGDVVLHYRLERELGRGGMGTVWLAFDTRLEREVALKFLLTLGSLAEEARERLVREARLSSSLEHPGVVTVHAIESVDDGPFVVMEVVRGDRIDTWVERDGQSVPVILRLVAEAAEAVGEAHARGIVHRDLKPSNLFVDDRDRVRVLDFGLAVARNDTRLTSPGSTVGTLGYIAPEQLRGEEVGPAADVFALGVVLHELLTGEPLFDRGQGVAGVIHDVLELEPPTVAGQRPGLPRGVEAVVRRALSKDAESRYADCRELAAALRELLEEDSSSRLEAIAEAQVERHWRPRIVSLTVALTAMTALVLYLFLDRSEVVGNGAVSTFRQWTPRPLQLFVEGQRDPEFSPDGSRIAFVAPVDGVAQLHVATLDAPSPTVLTDEARPVSRPQWAPDGQSILYLVDGEGTRRERRSVHLVPILGGTPRKLFGPTRAACWHPSGERVFHVDDSIAEFELATSTSVPVEGLSSVLDPRLLVDPAYSPDGQRLVYTEPELGVLERLVEYDLRTSERRYLTDVATRLEQPAYTPDGRYVIVSAFKDTAMTLFAVDTETGEFGPVTEGTGSDVGVAVGPGGSSIAYTNLRSQSRLMLFDPESANATVLQNTRHSLIGPRFSPDGNEVAFCGGSGAAANVFVVPTTGGTPRAITDSPDQLEIFPQYTPDGAALAYYVESAEGSAWVRQPLGGGAVEVVLDGLSMGSRAFAALSPSGDRVAYYDLAEGLTVIVDPATGEPLQTGIPLFAARWSPDGTRLVGDTEGGDIGLYDLDAGTLRITVTGDLPTFGPDGKVWFVRETSSGGLLLSYDPLTEEVVERAEIGFSLPGTFSGIDVSADGHVVWAEYEEMSTEIVLLKHPEAE